MKKKISLLKTLLQKAVFALCIFLSTISCTKKNTTDPPPPPPPPDSVTVSIFNAQIPSGIPGNDSAGRAGIELGVKFVSAVDGEATGISFYKTPANIGTHTAQLYSADGTLLDSGLFTNETDSGWQTALFTNAVPITANTTYIAAYHSSLGNYFSTLYGLKTAIDHAPLTALADGTVGINGIFKYTIPDNFPDSGYLSSNYWVDILEKIKK